MTLAQTGFTSTSVDSFIIDAATLYRELKYDQATGWTGVQIGATTGGVKVSIKNTYRKIDVDGTAHMDVQDLNVLSAAQATASASVKEITLENLRLSTNGKIREALPTEAPSGYKVIESKRYLEKSDYIDSVAVVGVHNKSKLPIIFILDNVLATSSSDLEFKDGDEAIIPLELQANASVEQLAADQFPWRTFYPDTVA